MQSIMRLLGISIVAVMPLAAPPAQAAVLYVSAFGNDANPGTNLAPKLTLQGAVNAAAPNGDTIFIDTPHDVKSAVINNKGLSIISLDGGGIFSVDPGATSALTINNGPTNTVNILGMPINLSGAPRHGITFNSGHKLGLDDITIRGGTGTSFGLNVVTNSNAEVQANNVDITEFGGNFGGGVRIKPRDNAFVDALFQELLTRNSGQHGLLVDGVAGTNRVFVENSTFTGSKGTGMHASGAKTTVGVGDSTFSFNGRGINRVNNAKIESHGGNRFFHNVIKGIFSSKVEPE